jgi:hypothetical protein
MAVARREDNAAKNMRLAGNFSRPTASQVTGIQQEASMSKGNLFVAATWATGTFAIVLVAGMPRSSVAVDKSSPTPLVGPIQTPTLVAGFIELSVDVQAHNGSATRPAQNTIAPGEPVKLIVRASNHGPTSQSQPFTIRISAQRLPSLIARTLPIPQEFWKHSDTVALDAGQCKSMTFTAPAIPTNQIVSIDLSSGNNTIVVYRFAPAVKVQGGATTQPVAIIAAPSR